MTELAIQKITTPAELENCLHIRTLVFIEEQKVPVEEEIDGRDPEADHYLLSVDGTAAATARVRHLDEIAKIERVAVLKDYRGRDLGKYLMEFIMDDIRNSPTIRTLKLGAQVQVIPFYEKLGFECYGAEFLDAGIRHRWMKRPLA